MTEEQLKAILLTTDGRGVAEKEKALDELLIRSQSTTRSSERRDMPQELKPCPWPNCKSADVCIQTDGITHWVECDCCFCQGPSTIGGPTSAASYWNAAPRRETAAPTYWAYISKRRGRLLVDSDFDSEARTWEIALGWPHEDEIEYAKQYEDRVVRVIVEEVSA